MSPAPGSFFRPVMREGVGRVTRRFRRTGAGMALSAGAVAAAAAGAWAWRLAHPVRGGLGAVLLAGAVGLAGLIGGAVAMSSSAQRVRRAASFEQAAETYLKGWLLAGGMNLAAGLVTVIVILANGASAGLWLPEALVVVLNVLGILLAVPRIRRLRQLHYTPTLPNVRL